MTGPDGVALDASNNLRRITIALGWDPNVPGAAEFDLDASALALTAADRVPSRDYFVYFNNLATPGGEIVHLGDNVTGEADGDDERIEIRLERLSKAIVRIVFPVTIHEGEYRRQCFGDVRNAYIRVLETETGAQLARSDLTTSAATETAMLFGEVYRAGDGWGFRPLGQERLEGLTGIAREYGVDV